MEQKFIQTICPGKIVRRIGCNGDQVSAGAIAKRLFVQIAFLKKCYPIVVFFDREKRCESCEDFIEQVKSELASQGTKLDQLCFGMPDRTIENWILADPESIKIEYDIEIAAKSYDGESGKAILKKLLGNQPYGETTDGLRLLKRICPRRASKNSASLKNFLSSLDIDCWWLEPLAD